MVASYGDCIHVTKENVKGACIVTGMRVTSAAILVVKMTKTESAEVMECTCERCEHVWFAQIVRNHGKLICLMPIACSKCKSAYWNRPRQTPVKPVRKTDRK